MPSQPTSIETLIVRIAAKERDALDELYRREASQLLGQIILIVRNRALAEDILHDFYVRLWSRAAQFDPQSQHGRAWLKRMARNLALNAIRYVDRESSSDSDQLELMDPDEVVTRLASEQRGLARCLETIDAEKRSALVNAYVFGLSHSELAQKLGAPLGTVKAWVQRSLQKLKDCMS